MTQKADAQFAATLNRIPGGLFLMTAAHDEHRSAVLTTWVQRCSIDPPMVSVAVEKGAPVESLIRDARTFALCQISEDDRFLIRKFADPPERGEDPFVTLHTITTAGGAPVVCRAMSYLDCELMLHVDLESDHRLFIAQVNAAKVMHDRRPAVCFGYSNGNGRLTGNGDASSRSTTNGTKPHASE